MHAAKANGIITSNLITREYIMNTTIIIEVARKTLAGEIPFPDIVAQLLAADVSIITSITSVGKRPFYGVHGDAVVTPISYEGLPPVASEFSVEELRADIFDSQRNSQPYRDFTSRALAAGTQGYFAFLTGQRVTYFGRQGDQHTEWFPGAGPKNLIAYANIASVRFSSVPFFPFFPFFPSRSA